MKRNNFILTALLSIPVIACARFGDIKFSKRPKKGIVIGANESRFYGKQKMVKNEIGRCVISSVDTDGDLFIMAPTQNSFTYKGGPPLHIHKLQDEVFLCCKW